ncbi:FAD-dependent oxidoreductase [Amycolatopsis sp. lyj-109]|uniref:FAD-dependent oxidoreductase n=1 Tax=Amycolatopsis sp. lyj-109 TaxID=2789287 RepID=UPI00397C20D2
MPVRDADVVVIGGGAMGSAAAWQLAARGADVVLLERFAPGHTRGASHGASRIFRLAYPDSVYIGLARQAEALWRELEDVSRTDLLTITGGVSHGRGPELGRVAPALEAAGLAAERLSHEEAVERWPGLRFEGEILHLPHTGRLHADKAVSALQTTAAKLGAVVRHETPVTGIETHGEQDVSVHTIERSYRARTVVVAAGAWTHTLLDGLVPLPPLRVTQEQPAHFASIRADLTWPAFSHHFDPAGTGYPSGTYGLATPGEGVKVGFHGVGPEVHPDRRDFTPEPGQLQALRAYVHEWLPGLDPDGCAPISCTYTTTPTSDFVLDRHGPIVVAAGFSGHGFKFTPVIGRILADLATTGQRPDTRFAWAGTP